MSRMTVSISASVLFLLVFVPHVVRADGGIRLWCLKSGSTPDAVDLTRDLSQPAADFDLWRGTKPDQAVGTDTFLGSTVLPAFTDASPPPGAF